LLRIGFVAPIVLLDKFFNWMVEWRRYIMQQAA
jgi:hypothetical protein